jgi:hypothetical protein
MISRVTASQDCKFDSTAKVVVSFDRLATSHNFVTDLPSHCPKKSLTFEHFFGFTYLISALVAGLANVTAVTAN